MQVTPLWKEKTPRDKKYLEWVRTLPCCACGKKAPSEAHHEGERGIALKTSDYNAIPLCKSCHNWLHLKGKSILHRWKLDPQEVISRLNKEWRAK